MIARCRVHKERNVVDHLVEAERPWVRRKLRAAWLTDAGEAEAASEALANQLDRSTPTPPVAARGTRRDAHRHPSGVTGSLLKTVMAPIRSSP